MFSKIKPIDFAISIRFFASVTMATNKVNRMRRLIITAKHRYAKPNMAILSSRIMQNDRKIIVPIINEYLKQCMAKRIVALFVISIF